MLLIYFMLRTKMLYFLNGIISQIVLDKKGLDLHFMESYKVPVGYYQWICGLGYNGKNDN